MAKLSDVMNAAEEKAASLPATTGGAAAAGVPATAQRTSFTLDDMRNGGLSVDEFIKVKAEGLVLKDEFFDEIEVDIDTNEIAICQAIKYGNPAVYDKTFDGVTSVKGGSWASALEKARAVDAKVRPYMSADIPMTLREDVKGRKGNLLIEGGKRIGHSTSTTNRKAVQDFTNALDQAGLRGQVVHVKLGYQKMTKAGVNPWGIITFNLVGPAEAGGDE